MQWWKRVQGNFTNFPDAVLTSFLLLAAMVIVYVALEPDHKILKGTVLAYIVLP